MQTAIECIPCFVRQAEEAVALATGDSAKREKILRQILHALAEADWAGSPPAIAQRLHRIIRRETGESDPYREVKDRMNSLALEASGQTLHRYWESRRVDWACRMLSTPSVRIKEVALELGFSEFSYFSAWFKKHQGQSPRNWREDRHVR